jgi:hypothetical protein
MYYLLLLFYKFLSSEIVILTPFQRSLTLLFLLYPSILTTSYLLVICWFYSSYVYLIYSSFYLFIYIIILLSLIVSILVFYLGIINDISWYYVWDISLSYNGPIIFVRILICFVGSLFWFTRFWWNEMLLFLVLSYVSFIYSSFYLFYY